MAKIISVINYKGGVGKTTLTLQLGVGITSIYKKSVLLVDLDPQCSLSLATIDEHYWADRVEKNGSIKDVVQSFYDEERPFAKPEWIIENALDRAWDTMPGNTPGLDLLPSHLDLPDYEMRLVAKKPKHIANQEEFFLRRNLILRDVLAPYRKKYDYILCDCPPNIYMISRNAIIASDYYLVPTIPDFISCYGISFILKHIENTKSDVEERGEKCATELLGIVRNRVRAVGSHIVKEHEEQSSKLKAEYGKRLLNSMVMDRIGVAELLGNRQNIYTNPIDRYSEVRADFTALTSEVMNIIGK